MNSAEIRNAYGAVAELYISLFGAADHVHPDDLDLIRRHLGTADGPVLDLGCGPGHLTGYLKGLGVDIVGVDPVPEFIAHASATFPDVRFSVGTLQTLAVADHSLAGILAWYSLIHLAPDEMDEALADLRRAIADDGTLVTACFTADECSAFDHKVIAAYAWPLDEFSQRLARAGFAEVDRLPRPASGRTRAHAAIAARAF